MPHSELIFEFALLFIACPLAYRFSPVRFPALPVLWLAAACAWWLLMRDPRFDRSHLWNIAALPRQLPSLLVAFAAAALLLWIGVHRFAPQLEWSLVRRNCGLWAMVMIAYPIISVYPQGVIYRAFFFDRYATLFPGKWTIILTSAAAFALMHIVFRNWLAVALTFAGGILFAARYAETGSLVTSCFEQSLYGCWLFTIGLGRYFYEGTIATVDSMVRS